MKHTICRKIQYILVVISFLIAIPANAQITGAWSNIGGGVWQATAGAVTVRATTTGAVTINFNQTMGCNGAYSDAAVFGNPSLRFTAFTPTTGNPLCIYAIAILMLLILLPCSRLIHCIKVNAVILDSIRVLKPSKDLA